MTLATLTLVGAIFMSVVTVRASTARTVNAVFGQWLAADERGSWIESANIHLSGSVSRPPDPLEIRIVYECQECKHTTDADRAFVDRLNARQREEEARNAARRLLPAPHPKGDGEGAA
jgi:hypothetical protein